MIGLLFGVIAVSLVAFMVFAMAMAEWADKDAGDIFAGLRQKFFPQGLSFPQVQKAEGKAAGIGSGELKPVAARSVKARTGKKTVAKTARRKPKNK